MTVLESSEWLGEKEREKGELNLNIIQNLHKLTLMVSTPAMTKQAHLWKAHITGRQAYC